MVSKSHERDPDYEYIFVPSIFHKGLQRRIFAKDYGKNAFRIKVRRKGSD